jgi:hypothetical protein
MVASKLRNLAPVLLVCLVLAACSDSALKTTSRALLDIAQANGALQTAVIESNKSGVLNDTQAAAILTVCSKINTAGAEASQVTRGLTKLDTTSKTKIVDIMAPIAAAIQDALAKDLVPITDAALRQKVQASLVTIQTAINSIRLVLVSS